MSNRARQAILVLMAAATIGAVHAETTKPQATNDTEARCVPHFDGGSLDGYRCLQIQPGSRYDRLGLKSGDVIRSIDGARLEDPLTALEKLGRLSADHHGKVALTIERDGQEISRTVDPETADRSKASAGKKVKK